MEFFIKSPETESRLKLLGDFWVEKKRFTNRLCLILQRDFFGQSIKYIFNFIQGVRNLVLHFLKDFDI